MRELFIAIQANNWKVTFENCTVPVPGHIQMIVHQVDSPHNRAGQVINLDLVHHSDANYQRYVYQRSGE